MKKVLSVAISHMSGLVVGFGLMVAASSAGAATIFGDDFNRPDNNTVGNGWSVININDSDGAIVSNTLRLRNFSSSGTATAANPDAAVYRTINITGFTNIQLAFDWRPLNADSETGDKLWASYNLGSGWVNLGSGFGLGSDTGAWTSSIFDLPIGASDLSTFKIRLWTDVSTSTEGASVDNVRVLGNPIITAVPEPEIYAMMLAGLGLMGFVARRRQLGSAG
jgi:hypothetical protein